jgi:hypothetical protein
MGVGILHTCRQIYHEANPILYSKNRFEFKDPKKALRFTEQIGPVNLKLIKKHGGIFCEFWYDVGYDSRISIIASSQYIS